MAKEKSFVELVAAYFDGDGVQVTSAIGADGKEYPDPVPMEPPIGYDAPPDIMQLIRSMVRNERLMAAADAAGYETFDEAEDFEIEDDPLDPLTPYEKVFEPPVVRDGTQGANGGGPAPTPAAPVVVSKPDVSDGKPLPVEAQPVGPPSVPKDSLRSGS